MLALLLAAAQDRRPPTLQTAAATMAQTERITSAVRW
jgi:hypothetical protein